MTVRTPKKRTAQTPRPIIIDRRDGFYSALGYKSARTATAENRSYSTAPSTEHELRDRKALINQSRAFRRDNPIYKGMIDAAVSYIVANGFELQVRSGRPTVDKKIESLWRNWFRSPEITSLHTGPKLAQMVCREVLVAGDVAMLKTDKALVQVFEAEQIAGKGYTDPGIKTNKLGQPTGFYLCPWTKTGVRSDNIASTPADYVLYIANLDRPSQLRGVPAAQSSFAMLHRINDICDSEAIAWQLLSRLAVTVNREDAAEAAYLTSRTDDTKSDDEADGDLATRVTDIDYALMFHANPGEKVAGVERNIPGQNFGESLRMFLRMLGLPLGLPLEIVLLDWTQSNYSQSRGVLLQAYQRFLNLQALIETRFYRPLFDWRLAAWQSQGLIGQSRIVEHEWIKPVFPWIDQLKEAQAWATQVERGFTTHSQVCKSLNRDRADENERRQREYTEAIEIAQQIEKKTGVTVPWEPFAGLKAAGSDKSLLAQDAETESPNENTESLAEAVAEKVIAALKGKH